MKFLTLLASRLALYFQKSKALFLLFCFGGMLSALAFLYFYGNYVPNMTNRESDEFYYRDFQVIDGGGDASSGLSAAALRDIAEDPAVEGVSFVHIENGDWSTPVAACLGEDPSVVRAVGKDSFEGEDPYSVIVPSNRSKLRVGEEWDYLGKRFTVIGIHSYGDYLIPAETYEALGLTTSYAEVYAAERKDAESGVLLEKLRETFPEAEVAAPSLGQQYDTRLSIRELRNLSIAYGVEMLAFFFLFLQMVEDTAKETAICRILGATGTKLFLCHFCEVLTLSTLSTLGGCLLHKALYPGILEKLNRVSGISYSLSDYLLVFLFMVGISLALSIPYLLRSLRLTPLRAHREAL